MVLPGKLRVYSDCAGLASELVALTLCGLAERATLVGWSEIDEEKQLLHKLVCERLGFNAQAPLTRDVSLRDHAQAEASDLYVSGFPCPSFSSLGKGQGDKVKKGMLLFDGLRYICHHQPMICIFENVKGLLFPQHRELTETLKSVLQKLGYLLYCKVLNTKDYGVPQSRPRVFVVAIKKKSIRMKFRWPVALKLSKKSLRHFIETTKLGDELADLSHYENKYGRNAIWEKPYVLDIGASKKFQSAHVGVAPCLTRSRLYQDASGFYIPKLRRRLNVGEAAKLQGWPRKLTKLLVRGTSGKIVGGALGDGMSINVLAKVILAALECVGFIDMGSGSRMDPWRGGSPEELASAADRHRKLLEKEKKMERAKAAAEKKAAGEAGESPSPETKDGKADSSTTNGNAGSTKSTNDAAKALPKKSKAAPQPTPPDEDNRDYYAEVSEDVRRILKHLGSKFGEQPALEIADKDRCGEGGVQEPYSKAMCERALGNQGSYVAAGNLLWANYSSSATPGIPLSRRSVVEMADFRWPVDKEPEFVKILLEFVAPDVSSAPETPQGLQLLSPEGYLHAILHAAARQLPKHKERWAVVLRSVPICLTKEPSDLWIHAWNNRNAISQDYESLGRSAWQTAVEIKKLKGRYDTDAKKVLTAAEFTLKLKNAGLKKASSQDDLSTNLVNNAIHIAEKLSGEEVLGPIRDLEQRFGKASFFNSMVKLHALATRVKPSRRDFVFQGLRDLIVRGLLDNDEVTKTALLGDKNSAGLISLLELKAECLTHWQCVALARAKIDERDRKLIAEALASHQSYNDKMLGEDVAWQGPMAVSSVEALKFLEELVFHKKFDHQLKQLARGHKIMDEVMENEVIKEAWDKVVALRENELTEQEVKEKASEAQEPEGEETSIAKMRKAPTSYTENSHQYWLAVANASVRRLLSFVVLPTTQRSMELAVGQSALKDVVVEAGSKRLFLIVVFCSHHLGFGRNDRR
ncbi:Modification methylase SsoII (M.SsoII) (Cytosine-specific methyltransferase SsoII) [Durusdinium trenchii]|uniref:Modification methylase SsoII (M.SsoII) (Cytosine-specific methyltransferase SsoII) n=1 Tax=Durusdinium trenchii TaxID=1381693 RepID=A0ABP0PFW6_9DINO